MNRRDFITAGVLSGLALALRNLKSTAPASSPSSPSYGPLRAADANGLQLPDGFTSRVIATTGEVVPNTGYRWHVAPDGGATFATPDGGWIYVSNCEASPGGVGMVRFDANGGIVDARRILDGSSRNCAGGPTPWGTWLSCEEVDTGRVWECDPTGNQPSHLRPAMGRFMHEAAAVDADRRVVYLTEDAPDGGLYRFVPSTWPHLDAGELQVLARPSPSALVWTGVPDPSGAAKPTRRQVPGMVVFNGGEGAWFDAITATLLFTTKGDSRVWAYDAAANTLAVLYDVKTSSTPVLSGVDNVTVSPSGDLYVAEDGGNMELVVLNRSGEAAPFLRLPVSGSEITGPAFDPSGTRLYFSSQRNPGRTFEVTGPFRPGRSLPGRYDRGRRYHS